MEKKKNNPFSLFQWWKIEENELVNQIVNYDSLNWWTSARTISVTCLLFSSVLTTLFVFFKLADASALVDVGLMLLLCPFMYKGYKVSFVFGMFYWTLAKISGISTAPQFLITSVIWWALYMRFFYLAFRVEKDKILILQKIAVRPTNNYSDSNK